MSSRIKKFALISTIILGASTVVPAISVGASELAQPQEATSIQENTDVYGILQEEDYQQDPNAPQLASWQTKLAKTAINAMLKNKKTAVSTVETLAGKRAANAFSKHFDKIAKQVKPLLKWTDVPSQAVADAVYRGLINAGVARSTAKNAANAIKQGLSWII
jgi:hypothetical protein